MTNAEKTASVALYKLGEKMQTAWSAYMKACAEKDAAHKAYTAAANAFENASEAYSAEYELEHYEFIAMSEQVGATKSIDGLYDGTLDYSEACGHGATES